LNFFFLFVSPRINISGEKPKDRSWHTLTPIGDDRLFLFGGLSSDNVPLSKYFRDYISIVLYT